MNPYNKKNRIMSQRPGADNGRIRVQLDGHTEVYLKSMKSFEFWKGRYPDARVLDASITSPGTTKPTS